MSFWLEEMLQFIFSTLYEKQERKTPWEKLEVWLVVLLKIFGCVLVLLSYSCYFLFIHKILLFLLYSICLKSEQERKKSAPEINTRKLYIMHLVCFMLSVSDSSRDLEKKKKMRCMYFVKLTVGIIARRKSKGVQQSQNASLSSCSALLPSQAKVQSYWLSSNNEIPYISHFGSGTSCHDFVSQLIFLFRHHVAMFMNHLLWTWPASCRCCRCWMHEKGNLLFIDGLQFYCENVLYLDNFYPI